MQFALLIYERPHDFDRRDPAEDKVYTGAWQAWHKAWSKPRFFVGGSAGAAGHRHDGAKDSKRLVQDGPYANTKEQLGGFTISNCRRSMLLWRGGALPGCFVWRCRSAAHCGRSSQACDG